MHSNLGHFAHLFFAGHSTLDITAKIFQYIFITQTAVPAPLLDQSF